ncbi:MAG: NAD(P)H-dependent glycerol-3-phosphate dehydrogenase, partial [Halomonas venusta]|nr:NAD(P)H-dependent glycerol-3-phosphate dehydrogenase [Halomonas venusta]
MADEQQMNVAVLGGGSFGTALASIAADNGAKVRQWMRDEALVTQINHEHRNGRYLPHYVINPAVIASTDLQSVLEDAELVLIAIPSKAFRSVVQAAKPWLAPEQILVSTTKGIEQDSFLLMSQVLEQETGFPHVGVIAGPNLASEIADKQLTATVIASSDALTRTRVQQALGCRYFRVYASNDRHGVELGGALKNIYAIAAGIAHGLGYGDNFQSVLMSNAIREMKKFIKKVHKM